MEQWQTIYSTNKFHKAEMLKEILISNGVDAVVLNQKDSLYLFGEIEVKVENKNADKAYSIINDFKMN